MILYTHTDPAAFDQLHNWDTLVKQNATNTIFLAQAWQKVWWQSLGEGDLRILELREGDKTVGIAPLFFEENALGATHATFVGCKEVADYLDFIMERGHEEACLNEVLNWLGGDQCPKWDTLSFCNVPEYSPTLALLEKLAHARGWTFSSTFEDVCPLVKLPAKFEDYLAMLDGKERRELVRKLRRAEDEDVAVTFATDPSSLSKDMDDFLRLMRASMLSKDGFMTPRMERFFRAMSADMQNAGLLQLSFLEVNGERAATYLNFVWDNQVLVYNSGLDPTKFAYLSPGQVLVAKLIEKAIADQHTTFDFLQGNEEYKYKLGGKDVKVFSLLVSR